MGVPKFVMQTPWIFDKIFCPKQFLDSQDLQSVPGQLQEEQPHDAMQGHFTKNWDLAI